MKFSQIPIISATEVARNFSAIAEELQQQKRAFVMKNNRFCAVLLSCDEYERLENALTVLEAIYRERKGGALGAGQGGAGQGAGGQNGKN